MNGPGGCAEQPAVKAAVSASTSCKSGCAVARTAASASTFPGAQMFAHHVLTSERDALSTTQGHSPACAEESAFFIARIARS